MTSKKKCGEEYLKRLRWMTAMPDFNNLKAKTKTWKLNLNDAENAFSGKKLYIATSMFAPSEILAAMDVINIPTEPMAVSVSMMNIIPNLIARVEDEHFPGMHLCSALEAMWGMFEYGIIPPPRAFVTSPYMCEDAQKMYEKIARRFDAPVFVLDVPFLSDDSSIAYLSRQLHELTIFLEKMTGSQLDHDRLVQAVNYSNEANIFRRAVFKLRQGPVLMNLSDVFPIYPLFTKFGRPEIVDIYETLHQELAELQLTEQHKERKFRVLWLGMIPLLSNNIIRDMEQRMDIGFVMEENSCFSSFDPMDPEKPLDAIARRLLSYHPLGPVERRVEAVRELVKDYAVDGVIHFMHKGCRIYNGGSRFIKEALISDGTPLLELSGDILDKRNFAQESIRLRIEAFVEMLS